MSDLFAHYEQIMSSLAMGIFTVDKDWKITFFNKEAEKITGFTAQEAIGHKCYEIFRTDTCFTECYLRSAIETGESIVKARKTILDRRNKEVPVDITASILRNAAGEMVGGVESFLDATSRVLLEKKLNQSYTFQDIVGKDERIVRLFDTLPVVARSNASILITGETGTGKDLIAMAIHNVSVRRKGPFVKVNCAALPDNLLESELFGYEKGAFTDAKNDKPGRFQLAERGTIFLDEIGDLPQGLQAKLLQVLDENCFFPLGATRPVKVDVRVISSTNRNVKDMMMKGAFRKDLFYRLKVVEIELPPLRKRKSDIPLLIEHFLSEFSATSERHIDHVHPEAMRMLLVHSYPGNVRELKNIIEYASILCPGSCITPDTLPPYFFEQTEPARSSAGKREDGSICISDVLSFKGA